MKISVVILLLSFSLVSFAQKKITWENLDCEFKEVWSEEYQSIYMCPIFPKEVKGLDGERVEIEGVLTIVDALADYYVVGKKMVGFGCGTGSDPDKYTSDPRELLELEFKEVPVNLKHGQKIKVQGVIRLNEDDILHLVYIIEDAEIVEQ